jgi:CheY-like chemotaxis protein
MSNQILNILLADDDADDRMFFQDILEELLINATLDVVCDGVELMMFLEKNILQLPHVLFLDLNMPGRSGSECLSEIKRHDKLRHIPVIIYSTSANPDVIELLYHMGAHYYIRKEGDFSSLKTVIGKALALCRQEITEQPLRKNFLIL